MVATTPTAQDIGYPVTVRTARDQGPARAISSISWFIVHDTEGNWPSDAQYLLAPGDKTASAHAVIGPAGDLWYEVPLDVTAWTPGNDAVARKSVNVELSGFASKGYTDEQYHSLATFFRWCVRQGMIVPAKYVGKEDVPGICGHQDVANPNVAGHWGGAGGHADPGNLFSWDKLVRYINGAATPNDRRYFKETQHWLALGFLAFWDANGGLPIFGMPISEEFTENGKTVQYLERARFEINPAVTSNPWHVELGRVGDEASSAARASNPDAFKPAKAPTS